MSEVNVKICSKRRRSASLNVQRRRQRLIALWNTVRRFTVRKAALCLGVSRRTVERDLVFLKEFDLLGPRRSRTVPYVVVESGAEFMARFNAAHRSW
jgi:hypothetical protein